MGAVGSSLRLWVLAEARALSDPRTEVLGYDWEKVVKRFALALVSGLKSTAMVHPCTMA